ncbi:hypothetical protein GX441_06480 [bacterium]|nr:hypothetical protein [bacterium]
MYNTPPAEGERHAAIGFSNQYRVSTSKILEELRTFDSIRVNDPDAGRVDDLQIVSDNRIDAYQVKWSEYPKPFTFRELVKTGKRPSLIKQLADGQRQLRELNPTKRIVVHLVTNNYPSTLDKVFSNPSVDKSKQKSFAAFLKQCWEIIKESGISCIPE